ncbi:LysR family transcriptional regulator [Microlunatus soli]|uniref:DNA-binding transcriptional regulator, LysR family n=1 Tax=Microlunatus soli TaxID=630515 RepID=A0A1H1MXW5_9ACTN|nr:LysR family transcriptional regulator [Microlunatus soli]SDR90769.1 DNA-binding transcriptional regulator, LysR family [Microlunatus soli]
MQQLPERIAQLRIDRLRSLLAAAQYGSFSAAAESLQLSQPRVSTHIADLERVFRTTLFDRSRQPIALTEAGERLVGYARRAVDALLEAQAGLDESGQLSGRLVIGMYPSAAATIFGELVAGLAASSPELEIELWEGSTLELGVALAEGDVDLAIRPSVPEPVAADRLSSAVLWTEPLVAVLRADDPLAGGAEIELGELADRDLIMIGGPLGQRRRPGAFESQRAFARAGIEPRIAQQTNQPQTLLTLVRAGLGVGVTNRLAVASAGPGELQVRRVVGEGCQRQVRVWWRTASPLTRIHHAVIDECARLGRRLVPR